MAKKRKPRRNKKYTPKEKVNYMAIYLKQKKFSIQDLKCEATLVACHMLLENYIKAEEGDKSSYVIEDMEQIDSKLIYNNLVNLQDDLNKNIFSAHDIDAILNNFNKNQESKTKAKLLEPLSYFYNIQIETLKVEMLKNKKEDDKILWIPDLIALSLLFYMKNNQYTYKKFDFLDKYDFDKLYNIYTKTDILIKKKQGLKLFDKDNKTTISEMKRIASKMVDSLIKSKFNSK